VHVFHCRYRTFPRCCRESADLARLSTVVTLVGSGFAMWMRMRMRVMGLRRKLGRSTPQPVWTTEAERAQDTRPPLVAISNLTPWLPCLVDTANLLSSIRATRAHDTPTTGLLPSSAMASGNLEPELRPMDLAGGTGARFAKAIVIVAGSCALVASLLTFVRSLSHPQYASTDVVQRRLASDVRITPLLPPPNTKDVSKNYRKPVLQRYVVRILLMYVHHLATEHSLTCEGCLFTRVHHGLVSSPSPQRLT
jgi:hypothetical protein